MRSPEEIYTFIDEMEPFSLYTEKNAERGKAAIKFLCEQLAEDEDVKFAFYSLAMGAENGLFKHFLKTMVVFITDRRIMYAHRQTGLIATPFYASVSLKNMNDASISEQHKVVSVLGGGITIDTMNEKMDFFFPIATKKWKEKGYKDPATAIQERKIIDTLSILKDALIKKEKEDDKAHQVVQQLSGADEILKYKKLLDDGIITKEEFEAKKKQILGL